MSITDEPIAKALRAIIQQNTTHTGYHKLYSGKVVSQLADLSLDVSLDDESMPSINGVQLLNPIAGIKVKVLKGASVIVGFLDGKPSAPFAFVTDSSGLQEVEITAPISFKVTCPDVSLGGSEGDPVAKSTYVNELFIANASVWSGLAAGLASNPGPITGVVLGGILTPLLTTFTVSMTKNTALVPSITTKAV